MQTALFTYIGRKTNTLDQNARGRATPFFTTILYVSQSHF